MYGQVFLRVIVLFVGLYHVSSHKLDYHPNWKYLPINDCGYGSPSDRIVGGKQAVLGQFPWLARIGYKIKPNRPNPIYLCAGSLINKWFIITAVHCAVGVLGDTIHSVRLGENFVEDTEDCEDDICAPPVQDIAVSHVIKYDSYVGTLAISYGDIGLIKLAEEVHYTDYIQPICLPREHILDNIYEYLIPGKTTLEVAGWGMTNSVSGHIANKVMYVRIPVVTLDICRRNFKPNKIDDSQICVGVGDGKDSCVGDSGGPLMNPVALHSSPKYFLFGLVSYGMKWCGISAAVYTNVSHYMEWILDHVTE